MLYCSMAQSLTNDLLDWWLNTARWHSHLPMISSIGGRVNLSRLDQLTDKPDIRLRRRFARIERHRTDQIETRAYKTNPKFLFHFHH